ncbi:MAG: WYL domain-containing protein [Fibrobacterales bacterium]
MSSKFNRVVKLHGLFVDGDGVVDKEYALKALNCSENTFKRYLEELRNSGMPIDYDRKSKMFQCDPAELDRFEFPGLWFNHTELVAIYSLRTLMQSISDGVLAAGSTNFWNKIDTLFDERNISLSEWEGKVKILPIGVRNIESGIFNRVIESLVKQKRILLDYKPIGSTIIEIEVSPVHIVRYKDNWYLDGFCHGINELKTFALSSIKKLSLSTLCAHQIDNAELQEMCAGGYGIITGKVNEIAVLRFSGMAAEVVSDEIWHINQSRKLLDSGELELSVPYHTDRELVMDVLKWGEFVTVVSPESLKARVKSTLEKAVCNYS